MQSIIDDLKRKRDDIDRAIRVLEGAPASLSYQPTWIVPPYWTSPWYPQTWCQTTTGIVETTSSTCSIDSLPPGSSSSYTGAQ